MQDEDTAPDVYHKIIWEYPPKHPSRCPKVFHNNQDPNDDTMPYYICISSFLPRTSMFKFEVSGENQLKFLNAYNEKLEEILDGKEQSELKNIGYQLPCSGDSGSGHWMYDSEKNKRALVAITSHSASDTETGKYCGVATHSLITTYPSVLQWIKRYSEIL